jgi:purine-nucleoside phosphorylase
MTPHIEARKDEIAETVIMPGDPLRAKYIAEHYLKDYKLVNSVRNMYAYTGYYKDKRVTIFASGMGIPSMGIYAYELFNFYDVKKIIRIGTCGALSPSVKVFDVILADSSNAVSNYPKLLFNDDIREAYASLDLNNKIIDISNKLNMNLKIGPIITSDVFDVYASDYDAFISNFPPKEYLASEMESFVLFYLATKFEREASTLLTVVDSKYENVAISSEDRETSLNKMIKLALEAI